MKISHLALTLEWHNAVATNDFALHYEHGVYHLSYKINDKWYTYKKTFRSQALAFIVFVRKLLPSTEKEENLWDSREIEKCPVEITTEPEEYFIMQAAAKDPMAIDMVKDIMKV